MRDLHRVIRSLAVALPLFAVLAATPGPATADEETEKTIAARQGYFQIVRHNAVTLFAMAKGEMAYDADRAATAANNLLALSEVDIASLWPAGSAKKDIPGKTRALMKIWDDPAGFEAKTKAWREAVSNMADRARDGVEGVRSQAAALGGGCKGCHDTYRAETF